MRLHVTIQETRSVQVVIDVDANYTTKPTIHDVANLMKNQPPEVLLSPQASRTEIGEWSQPRLRVAGVEINADDMNNPEINGFPR